MREGLAALDTQRFGVIDGALARMLRLLATIERKGRLQSFESFKLPTAERETVQRFIGECVDAGAIARGGSIAVGAGLGASTLTTGLVGSFASASTGTAISSLSGAAAKSALLAWLGGGSLSAGGWGMAVGGLVLNGIAVAPAIGIGGFVLAVQGEKAITKAEAFAAGVAIAVAQLDALVAFHRRAMRRVNEVSSITRHLEQSAHAVLDKLEAIADAFDEQNDEHVTRLGMALASSKALAEIVRARVFDDANELDQSTEVLITRLTSTR